MKNTFKKRCALLLFGISLSATYGQQVITTDGGQFTSKTSIGSINYTVGQLAVKTILSSTGSLSEGVHQPYEITYVLGLKEAVGINLKFSVYPNPSTEYLILSTDSVAIENLDYQLYNLNGQMLQNNKIEANETKINMSDFVNSVYFLKIIKNNKEIKIIKIIKK